MLDNLDLNAIQDENARELIRRLLNLIEQLSADRRDAPAEIQRVRDEINRLKGEQGKPNLKAHTPRPPNARFSRASRESRWCWRSRVRRSVGWNRCWAMALAH